MLRAVDDIRERNRVAYPIQATRLSPINGWLDERPVAFRPRLATGVVLADSDKNPVFMILCLRRSGCSGAGAPKSAILQIRLRSYPIGQKQACIFLPIIWLFTAFGVMP